MTDSATTSELLVPNLADITRHLYVLFDPAFVRPYTDLWIEVAYGHPNSGNAINQAQDVSAFDLKSAAEFAAAKNTADGGYNLYVGGALRHGDEPRDGRAESTNYLASAFAWVDYDDAGDDERIQGILQTHKLIPAIVVTTGTTPHPRRQLCFRVGDIKNADHQKAVNTSLKNLLGSDDVDDPVRVLRLAGTINYPTEDKAKRGNIPEVTTLTINKDAPTYRAEQLIIKLDASADLTKKSRSAEDDRNVYETYADEHTDQYIKRIRELLSKVQAYCKTGTAVDKDKWHNPMRDALAVMMGLGWSNDQMRLIVENHCDDGFDDPDLDLLIDDARIKWNIPDPDKTTEQTQSAPKEIGMSADALCAKKFPPVKFVVPGYIVEGLTLFAGKPKAGKSWLVLHAALAVARDGFTLGDVFCPEGDVLYCALEDNWRRLQSRLRKLLGGEPAPKRLKLLTEMPRLANGGLNMMREWIESAEKPRLIVVDVLAKVRDVSRRKDQGLYDADYAAMQGLKALADKYGVAIVVVHHLRKMDADDPLDQISGTTGLAGSADSVLVLHKGSTGWTLKGRGRDLEEIDKAIVWNPDSCTWTIIGEASEVAQSTGRGAILSVLREAKAPLSPQEIADLCNLTSTNAKKLLVRMAEKGEVTKIGRGQYIHPDRHDLNLSIRL